jgi:hypothetical protein
VIDRWLPIPEFFETTFDAWIEDAAAPILYPVVVRCGDRAAVLTGSDGEEIRSPRRR